METDRERTAVSHRKTESYQLTNQTHTFMEAVRILILFMHSLLSEMLCAAASV